MILKTRSTQDNKGGGGLLQQIPNISAYNIKEKKLISQLQFTTRKITPVTDEVFNQRIEEQKKTVGTNNPSKYFDNIIFFIKEEELEEEFNITDFFPMTWTAPVDCYVTMRWFFNSENFDAGVRLSVPGDNNWNAFHYSHIPLPAQENTTISLAKGVTMTFGMAATNAFTPEAKPTLNEKMIGAFFFFYYYPMDHTYL